MNSSDIKTALVVAPHLVFPLRNGADTYIAKKWAALHALGWHVTLVAADGTYSSSADGNWTRTNAYPDTKQSQLSAVLEMLFRGKDYYSAKFITSRFVEELSKFRRNCYSVVILSYLCSTDLLANLPSYDFIAVEAHNFDPKFFLDRFCEMVGPKSYIAAIAAARSFKYVNCLNRNTILFALGDSDTALYRGHGFLKVLSTRIGFDLLPNREVFASEEQVTLAFVGSLSVAMNTSAVLDFIAEALPVLRANTNSPIMLRVIGSGPSRDFSDRLRETTGVELFADVGEDQLKSLMQTSTAAILPFKNSNGMKLKFATAASMGVPVLSYVEAPPEFANLDGIVVSDCLDSWIRELKDWGQNNQRQRTISRQIQHASREYSWARVAETDMGHLVSAQNEY